MNRFVAAAWTTESHRADGLPDWLTTLSRCLAIGAVLWSATSQAAQYDWVPDATVTEPGAGVTFDGSASVGDAGDLAGPPSGDTWATGCTTCDSLPCGCADHCGRHRTALIEICPHDHGDGWWIGRVDALILWRNAPPDRPILDTGVTPVLGVLNANGMDSTAAAGPRFSLFRVDNCTGHAIEATYLRAANFRSQRPLATNPAGYALAPPGIYGNDNVQNFESGTANLGSRLQSFEFNRYHCFAKSVRFLAGFRWIEWQEQFTLQGATTGGGITDFYQTNCFNDLYGGQIGIDANLLTTRWIRFDGLIKAGAYYNNAVQASEYTTSDPNNPGTASITVGDSPASGAFTGELGFTGVVPITNYLDFRFGYFGLWLSGIAQPTQQLSNQTLTPGQPAAGTLNTNGGVVAQGVSLGLEGRW
jgi:hypothetical protein